MHKSSLLVFLATAVVTSQAGWIRNKPVPWRDIAITNDARIIGGEIATHGQFPYQVAVRIDGSSFCGGSLIGPEFVLTAGHCADGNSRSFELWFGTQDRSVNEPERVIMTTTDKTVHELHESSENLQYDMALLKLPSVIQYTDFIQPVRLPRLSEINNLYVGVTGTVSGWGRIADDEPGAVDELRFVDLLVIDQDACLDHYGFAYPSQLCLETEGTKGSCSGDSGGPYTYDEGDGIQTQIGMVSFGSSAGCVAGPKGFVRVAFFVDWIQQNSNVVIRP